MASGRCTREIVVVAAITVGALVLALVRLGAQPLWLDEALSVWVARKPVGEMLSWVASNDNHPPLYYLLLRPVTALGTTEWVVRLPSVLFATATVVVTYAIGRAVRGPLAGGIAAVVLALSPWHLRYGQEARAYALLLFAVAVALWGFVMLLREVGASAEHTAGARTSFVRAHPHALAVYAVGALTALFTQYAAVFFVLGVNVVAVAWWLGPLQRSWTFARRWIGAHLGIAVLYLAWVPALLRQLGRVSDDFWMERASLGDGLTILRSAYTGWNDFTLSLPGAVVSPWLDLAVVAAIVVAVLRAPRWGASLAALPVLAVAAGLAVSIGFRPLLIERAFIWMVVPVAVLLGVAVAAAAPRRRLLTVGSAAVLLGLLVPASVVHLTGFERSPWDEVGAYVTAGAQEGDIVVPAPYWLAPPLAYYTAREGFLAADHLDQPHDLDGGATLRGFTDPHQAMVTLAVHERIWLVFSPFHGIDLDMFASVESVAVEVDEHSWTIDTDQGVSTQITVRLYDVVEQG